MHFSPKIVVFFSDRRGLGTTLQMQWKGNQKLMQHIQVNFIEQLSTTAYSIFVHV